MKRILFLFLFLTSVLSFGQKIKSKADNLFFEYAYEAAIQQYQREMRERPLTNNQSLNLANSYFKVGNYDKASKVFLEVYKKDSTMSSNHFNTMLQSMGKTSGIDRVKAFLETKKTIFANELMENAEFNFESLGNAENKELDYTIFNIDANSPQSDFSPAFYDDRLLFTSSRPRSKKTVYGPTGESYLDIYVSKFTPTNNIFKNPPRLEGIPDSEYHKATPYYSNALDKLFYITSNEEEGELIFDDNGKNTLAIGLAKVSIGPNKSFSYLLRDLSTSFYYPFYEDKSQRLFFAANFEDGYGGTDIYYVYTNYGRIMSAPVNLGPRINSPGNEIAPYVFEGSLYFSSDVFYGLGGMDIYKSNFQPDDSFSIPINLGEGINSKADDFGFIIRNEGEGLLGYFSSNREGGKGSDDIYGFIVDDKPGLKTIALKGRVLNSKNGKGIAKASIKVKTNDGELLKEMYANEEGEYQFEIPWKEAIVLYADKERHSSFIKTYNAEEIEKIQSRFLDIDLTFLDDIIEEKEDQSVIKLKPFFFERGKSEITPEIAEELTKVVEAVKAFPSFQLRIESHTDSRGGSSSNFKLSQKRSDAIRDYLLRNGVSSGNILYSVGYGEDKILNNCRNGVFCLDVLHKKNERSLIVVLNYNLLN